MIVTSPSFFPVTTPLADTVALSVLELDQKKLWWGTGFPLLSFAVAVSCMRGSRLQLLRRRRDRDGRHRARSGAARIGGGWIAVPGLTVMVARPDFPSAFAATCDVPTARAVTTPASEMLTILGSCTVQVTAASGTDRARFILNLRLQGKLGVERERRAGWAHDDRGHLRCRVGRRATARPTRQRDHGHGRKRASAPRHAATPSRDPALSPCDVRRGLVAFDESSSRRQVARRCRSPSIRSADGDIVRRPIG